MACLSSSLVLRKKLCVCIYIYTHTHTYMYRYIGDDIDIDIIFLKHAPSLLRLQFQVNNFTWPTLSSFKSTVKSLLIKEAFFCLTKRQIYLLSLLCIFTLHSTIPNHSFIFSITCLRLHFSTNPKGPWVKWLCICALQCTQWPSEFTFKIYVLDK